MNKKLRLVVTAECHNKCPMCCNNRIDLAALPVVDRWDYDEIMITGGEPVMHCVDVLKLIEVIRSIWRASGWKGKIYVYTAIPSAFSTWNTILASDGIVATPHTRADWERFCDVNKAVLNKRYEAYGKSLRLNLFPEVRSWLSKDIDLSLWKIKGIEWIKDCPVPDGEDLRRINTLFSRPAHEFSHLGSGKLLSQTEY